MSDAESQKPQEPGTPAAYTPALRRWIPFIAVLCGLFLLYLLDGALKDSDVAGFAPSGATLIVASDDLGHAWQALESTAVHQRVMDEAPQFLYNAVMEGRKASGIRWTPGRWGRWFGKRFVLGRLEGQPGLCMRPGILARAATSLARIAATRAPQEGVYQIAGLAYGWRDGFLIVSPSPEYISAALADAAETIELSGQLDSVFIDRREDPACRLTVRSTPDLSIDGWVDFDLPGRDAPLTLAGTWPEEPLLEVTGSSAEELIELVADLLPEFPGTELLRRAFEELEAELPGDWAIGTNEFSLALMSVDTSEFLAVPEIAMALRGERDLARLRPPRDSIRHEWAGRFGWFRPWLGEKMSVCVVGDEDLRLFTSRERTMARYIGRLEEGRATESDLLVSVDLAHFSSVARELTRRAAEHELLPYHSVEDTETHIIPALDAMEHLGTLRLDARAGDGGMYVHAYLESKRVPSNTARSGT